MAVRMDVSPSHETLTLDRKYPHGSNKRLDDSSLSKKREMSNDYIHPKIPVCSVSQKGVGIVLTALIGLTVVIAGALLYHNWENIIPSYDNNTTQNQVNTLFLV